MTGKKGMKKHSLESRKVAADKRRGIALSQQHRASISDSLMGHEESDTTRAKKSLSKLGKPSNAKGKKWTQEQKDNLKIKMVDVRATMDPTVKQKMVGPRQKAGTLAMKNKWDQMDAEERVAFTRLKGTESKEETKIVQLLQAELFPDLTKVRFGRYTVDGFSASHNLIFEYYGCWVHKCPRCGYEDISRCEHDKIRMNRLMERGHKLLIVWSHEVKGLQPKDIVELVKRKMEIDE